MILGQMLTRHGPCHLNAVCTQHCNTFGSNRVCHRNSSDGPREPRFVRQTIERPVSIRSSTRTASSGNSNNSETDNEVSSFKGKEVKLPTQGESLVKGVEPKGLQLQEREHEEGPPDFVFLSVRFYPVLIISVNCSICTVTSVMWK